MFDIKNHYMRKEIKIDGNSFESVAMTLLIGFMTSACILTAIHYYSNNNRTCSLENDHNFQNLKFVI